MQNDNRLTAEKVLRNLVNFIDFLNSVDEENAAPFKGDNRKEWERHRADAIRVISAATGGNTAIKLAILRDVARANNGYVTMQATMVNVRNATPGLTLSDVRTAFKELVEFRHIVLLGVERSGQEYYCLPENKHIIMQMMEDLTR